MRGRMPLQEVAQRTCCEHAELAHAVWCPHVSCSCACGVVSGAPAARLLRGYVRGMQDRLEAFLSQFETLSSILGEND